MRADASMRSGHPPLQPEDGGRRGKRADADRVEKIRREADREIPGTRSSGLAPATFEDPPTPEVPQRHGDDDREKYLHQAVAGIG